MATAPPPAFSDIAKAGNDLINKDFYHLNAATIETKIKAPNGLGITAKGTLPHGGNTAGSLEAKKVVAKGITVTENITTTTATTTKVELDNVIASGLKAEVLANFSPNSGFAKGQKLSLFFKQGAFHARGFADYVPGKGEGAPSNVLAAVDGVFKHEAFLVGAEAAYDVQKAALTRYALAVGYQTGPFSGAITGTNNLSVFTASIYQKVNEQTEAGFKAAYDTKSGNSVGLEMAAKYKLDPLSFAKAKLNDRGILALAYNTKVNKGLTWGLGMSLDTQKLNESGHKIGTSLTFEA